MPLRLVAVTKGIKVELYLPVTEVLFRQLWFFFTKIPDFLEDFYYDIKS